MAGWPDVLGEPGREGGTRHGRFVRQHLQGPVMPRVAVDRGQAPSDVRVVERAEPAAARRGIVLEPGADGLDDDDVGEAGGDRLAAWP